MHYFFIVLLLRKVLRIITLRQQVRVAWRQICWLNFI